MSLKKTNRKKLKVEIYSKPDCHLCDEAKSVLLKVQKEIPFEYCEINISNDLKLFDEFKEQIPVIFINEKKAFKFRVSSEDLRKKLLFFMQVN